MKPAKFPQSNRELTRPAGTTEEECESLFVWTDDKHCLSLWKPTWQERLRFLFKGELWLWVWSGSSQPPVSLQFHSPFERPNNAST